MPLIEAVLQQSRLDALTACDANVTSYDPNSFLMIFRCRGRQMPFIIKPLLCLVAWGVTWALIFARFEHVRLAMLPLNNLITPLLTPVSFLLVFRLGRAAVCYWDASLVRIRVTLAQPGASPSPSPITHLGTLLGRAGSRRQARRGLLLCSLQLLSPSPPNPNST